MTSSATRLLIVEDDRGVREALVDLLADEGIAVAVAGDGEEALRWLADADPLPSLILLDLMMPVMDGFTFRERQRADPRLADIPVVVLTADQRAVSDRSLDADAWLQKPFIDVDQLLELLERFGIR